MNDIITSLGPSKNLLKTKAPLSMKASKCEKKKYNN